MTDTYTRDYFIDHFEKIPAHRFGTEITNCALAHCGLTTDLMVGYIGTEQSTALIALFGGRHERDYGAVYEVNDGTGQGTHRFGKTPKERILNYLKSI